MHKYLSHSISVDEFFQIREESDALLEYIDETVYMSPSTKYQRVSNSLEASFRTFLEGKSCELFHVSQAVINKGIPRNPVFPYVVIIPYKLSSGNLFLNTNRKINIEHTNIVEMTRQKTWRKIIFTANTPEVRFLGLTSGAQFTISKRFFCLTSAFYSFNRLSRYILKMKKWRFSVLKCRNS